MVNVRKLVVGALCRVEEDNAFSNLVLNGVFSKHDLTKRDKSFASALFYGVLDRKITIDFYINCLSKIKVKKMQPVTREALRLGVFQIAYMNKIPVSAAVNESVNIVKKSKENKNAGFVNAVLRSAIRSLPKLPEDNTEKSLSIRYSCEENIVKELISDYGKEQTTQILTALLNPAELFIRYNSIKITKQDFESKLKDFSIIYEETELNGCYKITEGDIFGSELYKNGLFFVQDISAANAAETLCAKKGERVLDVCAAPGGKSFTSALLMENSGEIVSCDLYEQRVSLIENGAKRLSINCIKPLVNDASVFNKNLGEFNGVICDVPCSGWGVMRRKPEIKYKKDNDFSELQELQQKILYNSAKYLKNGGRMVYSTCTIRKAENEKQVQKFLENNKNFVLENEKTTLPTGEYDGFYYAVLKKR